MELFGFDGRTNARRTDGRTDSHERTVPSFFFSTQDMHACWTRTTKKKFTLPKVISFKTHSMVKNNVKVVFM